MIRQTDVVILGGGPAGMTAAIWCKRLSIDHLLIEAGRTLGGQLFDIHNPIIDYPGVQAEDGRAVQQLFAQHVQALGCTYEVGANVLAVDLQAKELTVQLPDAAPVQVKSKGFILATGSSVRRLGVRGEAEMIKRGEVYSAARDSKRFTGKKVAVVGGGDRAVEGALLLAESGAQVVLIHRSDRFRARESLVQPVFSHPRIERLTHATVTEIYGEQSVQGVQVLFSDGRTHKLDIDALFVRIGVEPNSRLVNGQVEQDADGYIVTDATCQTSCSGVFAIGDVCTRPLFSSIASAAGQAMIAAKQLSLLLATTEKEEQL